MRTRRLLIVAILSGLLGGIGSLAAPAFGRPPDHGGCQINRQYLSVDDSGNVTVGGGSGRIFDCYY